VTQRTAPPNSLLPALLGLLGVTLALGIRFGAAELDTRQFLDVFLGRGPDTDRFIVLELRAPRALMAALVGGGLAVAGATFQALLRNPLAEPYILGVSGGAAAGAVLALAAGWVTVTSYALPLAAFVGAGTAIVLVFGVALSARRRLDVRVLLLSGVVVGAFFAAVIALVLSLSEAPTVRSAVLWMMGSLAGGSWRGVAVVASYTVPAVLVIMALSRPLNLISIGEETAGFLGTDVEKMKRVSYAAASLIAAAGVAFVGVIGFVGLVVPHVIRLLAGPDHRYLVPFSFLSGASFLALADLISRSLVAPAEVPVGVVTAFIGVPFFLLLLRRSLA
jgi:iron complex transport system permease protein